MSSRGVKDFLGKPAPPGYIAGLGRGATGFITRPDLGPGSSILALPSLVSQPVTKVGEQVEGGYEENANEEGLLASRGPQGADDDEADAVFAAVEAKMNERRGNRRATVSAVVDPNDPTTLFAAEKLKLRQVTAKEWAQLPESGDFIAKRVKRSHDKERYTPVPDSVILRSLTSGTGSLENSIEPKAEQGETDFRAVGETREKVLGARLDMYLGSHGPEQAKEGFDAVGYLSSLDTESGKGPQINDLRRARALLRAAIQANPTNPAAWLSAVKIEEVSGNLKQARNLLVDALEACPDNEDIWLEAVRMAPPTESALILQNALLRLSNSSRLWLFAASVEKDGMQGKKVLRRGLEANPGSVVLWKALVEREEDTEDARVLLAKAVECCSHAPELWIALAYLESHENARKVLNKARQHNPLSVAIWMAAARLEEAHGNEGGIVEKIVHRAVAELQQRGSEINRAGWIQTAYDCEGSGDVACAQAIVSAVAQMGYEKEETAALLALFVADAQTALNSKHPIVGKAFLKLAIVQSPHDENVWLQHVSVDPSRDNFEAALKSCPESIQIWRMYAEQMNSEQIFQLALNTNPNSEALWLAWIRYAKSNSLQRHQELLQQACAALGSEKMWKKLVSLEAHLGHFDKAKSHCRQALAIFPTSTPLWLAMGRLDSSQWESALQACPKSADITVDSASAALASSQAMRARAILERGRQALPDDENVWLASVKLERDLDAPVQARSLMTRALQKLPLSQSLWYEAIAMEAKPLRKAKAMEALRRCGQHAALVLLAIARMLESERNFSQAIEYYERSLAADSNIGDGWAFYVLMLRKREDVNASSVVERAKVAHPKTGPRWKAFRKQHCYWRQPFDVTFATFIESLLDV